MAPSMAEKYEVPLLGQIPIVQSIRENGDEGEPLRFQVACRIKWWDSPIPDVERLGFLCDSSDSVVEGPSEVESHDSRVG